MVEQMIMVMNAHPQVFVDISADNWSVPRPEFNAILKRLAQAGYGKRITFGSDQMVWLDAIPIAIESIVQVFFLMRSQKRDILYNNAARFLRLTPAEIARHYGRISRALTGLLPTRGSPASRGGWPSVSFDPYANRSAL